MPLCRACHCPLVRYGEASKRLVDTLPTMLKYVSAGKLTGATSAVRAFFVRREAKAQNNQLIIAWVASIQAL